MSAPSAARRCAWAMAAAGSRKRPPSENESGVTLSTPMTSGRRFAKRLRNRSVRGAAPGAEKLRKSRLVAVSLAMVLVVPWPQTRSKQASRASLCAVGCGESSRRRAPPAGSALRWTARSVADQRRQLLGAFDPALHRALLRQEPHQLALVGFPHSLDQVLGIAVFELVDGFDADGAQQL